MSIEGLPKKTGPETPKLRAVSTLNPGDIVLENGVPTEIKAKRRSGSGVTLELASGSFMGVDSESEEVEVPHI